MRATVYDVASRAGVSAMAVSAVLNGAKSARFRVSDEKAERIRQAALELHYQPNRMGQILRGARTNQIALVFQSFEPLPHESLYRSDVMNGIVAALSPHEYTITLCPQLVGDGIHRVLLDGRFDGVLWSRPNLSENMKLTLQNSNMPMVMLNAPPQTVPGTPSFCIDEDTAVRLTLNHLARLGHERVAFVTDPPNARAANGQTRVASLKSAARTCGLLEPGSLLLEEDNRTLASYADTYPPHTALVCCSSELAVAVLRTFEQLGIDVPGHISVIALDPSPVTVSNKPSLTAIIQPVEQMAFDASAHLLDLIQNAEVSGPPKASTSRLYDGRLEIGESSGPVRSL